MSTLAIALAAIGTGMAIIAFVRFSIRMADIRAKIKERCAKISGESE